MKKRENFTISDDSDFFNNAYNWGSICLLCKGLVLWHKLEFSRGKVELIFCKLESVDMIMRSLVVRFKIWSETVDGIAGENHELRRR